MREFSAVGFATELGITVAILAGGGVIGGYALDTRFGSTPLWTLLGAGLGIVLTAIFIAVRVRELNK